ncbi:anthranilate synthase / indole-3-glycerol phosphate synthase [Lodderomyces elongisporus]|uniref:anthranilate synthase / indole-3-glycerol phosphate synthase n=1 Tax=Lodderomyces elongisporus TaxID=36914 RepID=UPI00291D2E32|nr:anthranilate synthase / indole-3-glycerol phosphate synthase [Lodderomyces elongisporus]WLF76759.1 anthranilate synthase / indole-3-glycerol phosphate synthase [Lodderomyces elongisporus]
MYLVLNHNQDESMTTISTKNTTKASTANASATAAVAGNAIVGTSAIKRHVLMIDNYDSFTWNLYQYLHQSPRCGKVDVYRNDKIDIATIENKIKPDIIFISPGPGHPVTDSGISSDVIRHFKGKLPIFGVCMGQECIFHVFGGDVSYAGEIVHGKTTTIKHDSKGMFEDIPQSVAVTRYHSLAGSEKTLPECLEVTAVTETKPDVIMGVRHKKYTIEGVQFHPESILTESGQLMIDNLLGIFGGTWEENEAYRMQAKKTRSANNFTKGENILKTIYDKRQEDYKVIENLPGRSFQNLEIALSLGAAPPVINFYERLKYTQDALKQTVILSEFKRASPSKGDINVSAHAGSQALTYAINGCSTISVLTEPNWFKGSLEDLSLIRQIIDGPKTKTIENYKRPAVLRKEFIFSKYQILEARLAGADTVLLIVKMLNNQELLQELYSYSLELDMIPLVEVNDGPELEQALKLTYKGSTNEPLIIGVNNRNLTNFDVDLGTTSSLVEHAKGSQNGRGGDVLILALSGITSVDDVKKYKYEDNVDGFLIGESLMRAESKGQAGEFLHQLCNC